MSSDPAAVPVITFERGALLCRHWPDDVPLPLDTFWDESAAGHRVPAVFLRKLEDLLDGRPALLPPGRPLRVSVRTGVPLSKDFRPLIAWESLGRRGYLVGVSPSRRRHLAVEALLRCRVATLLVAGTVSLRDDWQRALTRKLCEPVGLLGAHPPGRGRGSALACATFAAAARELVDKGDQYDLIIADGVEGPGAGDLLDSMDFAMARFRLGFAAVLPGFEEASRLETACGPAVWLQDPEEKECVGLRTHALSLLLADDELPAYDEARRTFLASYEPFMANNSGAPFSEFVSWARRGGEAREGLRAWHRYRRLLALTEAKESAVGDLLEHHRGERVLIFTTDRASAFQLSRRFLIAPFTGAQSAAERRRLLAAFRRGEILALVGPRLLDDPLELPPLGAAVFVAGEHERAMVNLFGAAPARREGIAVYLLLTLGTVESRQEDLVIDALVAPPSAPVRSAR